MYSDEELSDDIGEHGAAVNSEYFISLPKFVRAVNEGTCRPGAVLMLCNSPEFEHDFDNMEVITSSDLEVLVDLLLSGKCPPRLRLGFYHLLLCPMGVDRDMNLEEYRAVAYPLDIEGLQPILRLLETPNAPEGMSIELVLEGNIGSQGAVLIAKSLAKGKGPRNLTLKLMETCIGLPGINAFAEGLVSGRYPEGFTLRLDGGDQDFVVPAEIPAAFETLALALRKGNCPKGLGLDFIIENADVTTALVGALSSGHCPVGLTLYLHSPERSCDDFLKQLFETGVWPLGLRLKLIGSPLSKASVQLLEKIHGSEQCIPGLRIREFDYNSEAEDEESPQDNVLEMTQTLLKQNDAWHVQSAQSIIKSCIMLEMIRKFSKEENLVSTLPGDVLRLIVRHTIPAWWEQAIPGHFKATGRIAFFKHIERMAPPEGRVRVVSDEDRDYASDEDSECRF